MKVLVLFNPRAGGSARVSSILAKFKAFLESEQVPFEIKETLGYRPGVSYDHWLSEDFTHITVIGGDGSLNEVVNALKKPVPISILPAGTGNDFSKTIRLGKNLEEKFHTALYGDEKIIDLGVCNDRRFINGVGIGFDGQIVEDMAVQSVPFLRGHAKYYYHVLKILSSYRTRSYRFYIDGKACQETLILMTIGNGTTFGGGFKLMPQARVDDGKLAICTIGDISPLRRFLNVSKLSSGSHGKLKEVALFEAEHIKVEENTALLAHMDGERLGSPPFEISILPTSLTIRVAREG
jgi:YegS/Rv2252/BmrU family lipid kinase